MEAIGLTVSMLIISGIVFAYFKLLDMLESVGTTREDEPLDELEKGRRAFRAFLDESPQAVPSPAEYPGIDLYARRWCECCEKMVDVDVCYGNQYTEIACCECGESFELIFAPTLE